MRSLTRWWRAARAALALADHADHSGRYIHAAAALLECRSRQSARTIQLYLARMRREQWLISLRFRADGAGRATKFRIHPLRLENAADVPLASIGVGASTKCNHLAL
jgi:hypothetical protein